MMIVMVNVSSVRGQAPTYDIIRLMHESAISRGCLVVVPIL